MGFKITIVFLLLLSFSCSKYQSEKSNNNNVILSKVFGGKKAAKNEWTSVVKLVVGGVRRDNTCSGVLIDPETVVTAAHCVLSKKFNNDGGHSGYMNLARVHIGVGDFRGNDRIFNIKSVKVHPDYVNHIDVIFNDYAYLKLENPVPADLVEIIPPISEEEVKTELGEDIEVRVVGFGFTGNGTIGSKNSVPIMMKRLNDHRSIDYMMFEISAENSGACRGDSGGPTFIKLKNGEWRILAISSYMRGFCSGNNGGVVGNILGAMRLKKFNELVFEGDRYRQVNKIDLALSKYREANVLGIGMKSLRKSLSICKTIGNNKLINEIKSQLYFRKGMKAFYKTNYSKAFKLFSRSSSIPSSSYYRALAIKNGAYKQGNYDDFLNLINDYIDQNSDKTRFIARAYYERAQEVFFYESNDYDDVKNDLTTYFKLMPNDHSARFLFASVLTNMNENQESLKQIEIYSKYYPKDSFLYELKAVNYKNLGEMDNMQNALNDFARKQKRVLDEDLRLFSKRKDYPSLLYYTEKLMKKFPQNEMGDFYLGECYSSGKGEHTKGLEHIDKFLVKNPDHVEGLNLKGIIHFRLNDLKTAEKYFKKVIKIDPSHKNANKNLGILLMNQERPLEALEVISKKINLEPQIDDLHFRGVIRAYLKMTDRAISDFERVIEKDAANEAVYYDLANLYFKKERYSDVLEMTNELISKNFLYPEPYLLRAKVYYIYKKYGNVIYDFELYQSLIAPKSPSDEDLEIYTKAKLEFEFL